VVISAGQHRKVSLNEFRPCCRALALRRRWYAVATQDIADRNLVAEIDQCRSDPLKALGLVLLGHANDQVLDVFSNGRPSSGP
jgi:hypothetical protein